MSALTLYALYEMFKGGTDLLKSIAKASPANEEYRMIN
jgi:hypothetical protein